MFNLRVTLKKSSFIDSFGRTHEISVFDFSIALIAMPLDKSCNAWPFVPRSSQRIFFSQSLFKQSTHAHTHACAQGESQASVALIDPSPHAVPECRRCIILGTGCRSILGRNTQGNFEKSFKKKHLMFKVGGVYSEEVHLYGKVKCTSTKHSK